MKNPMGSAMSNLNPNDLSLVDLCLIVLVMLISVYIAYDVKRLDEMKPPTSRILGDAATTAEYIGFCMLAGLVICGTILLLSQFCRGRQRSISTGEYFWISTLILYLAALLFAPLAMRINNLLPIIVFGSWILLQCGLSCMSLYFLFKRCMSTMHYCGCVVSLATGVYLIMQLIMRPIQM